MFKSLNKNPDSQERIRKLAIIVGLISLFLLMVNNFWLHSLFDEERDFGFPYSPTDFEAGTALASLLCLIVAIGLLIYRWFLKFASRK